MKDFPAHMASSSHTTPVHVHCTVRSEMNQIHESLRENAFDRRTATGSHMYIHWQADIFITFHCPCAKISKLRKFETCLHAWCMIVRTRVNSHSLNFCFSVGSWDLNVQHFCFQKHSADQFFFHRLEICTFENYQSPRKSECSFTLSALFSMSIGVGQVNGD